MDRVLAVDDNPSIQKLVSVNLQARGYTVTVADTGETALRLFAPGDYELVLLDLILPGLSGLEVCTQIRQQSDVPIIVLSAQEDEELKVRALDAGADDYLTKPFAFTELLARVQALIRRGSGALEPTRLSVGDLSMDLLTREVAREGRKIELQPLEFSLLEYLMRNAGGDWRIVDVYLSGTISELATRRSARMIIRGESPPKNTLGSSHGVTRKSESAAPSVPSAAILRCNSIFRPYGLLLCLAEAVLVRHFR